MTPKRALCTATVRPAEFFGLEAEMGELRVGFIGDAVLLDANPLGNIKHTLEFRASCVEGFFWIAPTWIN